MKKIVLIKKQTFANYLNERAFTLVEMLFAFSIFTIIIFFISPLFEIMLQQNDLQKRQQAMEWDVFCSQIKKEIRMSSKAQLVGASLVLTEDAGTIDYEQYGNVLRRRVNSTGHEVLLQNVSEVNFSLMPNTVRVTVKDLNRRDYIVNIYSFLDWNGAQ
ncbi:competence type IV pilus minor pilin ComGF [Bacillus sp. EB600]|uniref:competence type IV pilus minor pilin ComGF n=1 Tax=Bacillus sp. EB600 TaxID=2806345 RepID=UPI00210DE42D|nr:competence type IV pilus minor pilin ComGF [Bacillus sp. EB600]